MKSFLAAIADDFDPRLAADARRVMEAMGLPDAEAGEYLDGNIGKTVFLGRYGLLLRVGSTLDVEHDLVLKKLRASESVHIKIRTSDDTLYNIPIAVELLPGVEGVLKDEADGR